MVWKPCCYCFQNFVLLIFNKRNKVVGLSSVHSIHNHYLSTSKNSRAKNALSVSLVRNRSWEAQLSDRQKVYVYLFSLVSCIILLLVFRLNVHCEQPKCSQEHRCTIETNVTISSFQSSTIWRLLWNRKETRKKFLVRTRNLVILIFLDSSFLIKTTFAFFITI